MFLFCVELLVVLFDFICVLRCFDGVCLVDRFDLDDCLVSAGWFDLFLNLGWLLVYFMILFNLVG